MKTLKVINGHVYLVFKDRFPVFAKAAFAFRPFAMSKVLVILSSFIIVKASPAIYQI